MEGLLRARSCFPSPKGSSEGPLRASKTLKIWNLAPCTRLESRQRALCFALGHQALRGGGARARRKDAVVRSGQPALPAAEEFPQR
jgi:hypothetical protein